MSVEVVKCPGVREDIFVPRNVVDGRRPDL